MFRVDGPGGDADAGQRPFQKQPATVAFGKDVRQAGDGRVSDGDRDMQTSHWYRLRVSCDDSAKREPSSPSDVCPTARRGHIGEPTRCLRRPSLTAATTHRPEITCRRNHLSVGGAWSPRDLQQLSDKPAFWRNPPYSVAKRIERIVRAATAAQRGRGPDALSLGGRETLPSVAHASPRGRTVGTANPWQWRRARSD